MFQTYNNFVYKKPSSINSKLSKMSVLFAILDIEDKQLLSICENEDFDKIIRSTKIKTKLGKKAQTILFDEP